MKCDKLHTMAQLRLVVWTVTLAAVSAAMAALGRGPLAPPDVLRPSTWPAWAGERSSAEAAMAVLRLVVLGLALYLLVVTVLAVALRLGDAGRQLTVLDVVTLPFVRSIVQAGLGAGLVGATVAGVAAYPSARTAPTSADAAIVAADPSPSTTTTSTPERSGRDAGPREALTATRTEEVRTWTVAPGDHLWSIAERTVASSLGRTPEETEVARYWRSLIATNRHVLADPDNPDLLFSGQVLTLPQ
jgi:nucleoid-associated protein YgaU